MAIYRDGHCNGIPRIQVTAAERDWLYAERIRAMKECPDLLFQQWRRGDRKAEKYLSKLVIHGRDRDGSLECSIVIQRPQPPVTYRRKLRAPSALGSTSIRDIQMRQERRAV